MKKTYIDPEIQMLTVASADVITISGEDRTLGMFTVSGKGMMGFDDTDSWIW